MTEQRLSIAIAEIHVPEERVRPLSEAAAQALAELIREQGQLNPIAVYASNARKDGKPYTLIYGARRLRAMEILGLETIDAVVRTKAEAAMLEVSDNLATANLDALEKAEYLCQYRFLWEAEFGPIEPGRFHRGTAQRAQNAPFDENSNLREKNSFFKDLKSKFQISKDTANRYFKVGRLHKPLRDALRGTEYVNDHTYLRKLAKLTPDTQAKVTAAFRESGDLDSVLELAKHPNGKPEKDKMPSVPERRFDEAFNSLSRRQQDAMLSERGFIRKPLDPWPTDWPQPEPLVANADRSPLWQMIQNPYETLSVRMSYAEIEEVKREERAIEDMVSRWRPFRTAEEIQAMEDAMREEFAKERDAARAKSSRSGKSRRGRPPKRIH